ncbi:protein CFAP20DC-like [Amphiura filiformis]|uniref:protein CFAP20DC-like n=1 Tax=Amphiura filiformis TaxID=82378 RepID=UPI003B21C56A
MFKNVFQGGPSVEIFSSQGKDPLGKWKLMGSSSIQKVYEKKVKSYVHVLEGATTTTKIQLPKDSKQTLVLIQRYLVLQLLVPLGKDFSIEISVSDMSNNKRRLLFSTAQRDIAATPLHAKVPLTILKRAVWLNLCIDMLSIVGEAFRGQTYKSLDTLTISAACHLRKVFTMKCQLPDDTDDDDLYDCKSPTNENELDTLPKTFQFAPDVSYQTQVLTMNKLKCAVAKLRGESSRPPSSTETDLNSSMRGKQDDKPTHIAFGTKVLVPTTASGKRITSSTGSREGSSSAGSRTSRSSHSMSQRNDDSIPSARGKRSAREQPDTLVLHGHMRQKSDPGTEISPDSDLDKGTLSGSKTWSPGTGGIAEELASIKPHPPRQKSGDKSRRVIKVRPSSGKDRDSSDSRSRDNSGTARRGGTYERRKYSQDQASEESSDADALQRLPDAALLKSAAARIRTQSISEDEELFEDGDNINQASNNKYYLSGRTNAESYSESDDVLARSSKNVLSAGRGKVQRRKKKPERGRLDSYSETEENQQTSRYRSNGGRTGIGYSRGGGKSKGKTNGTYEAHGDTRRNQKGSGAEQTANRLGDRQSNNKQLNVYDDDDDEQYTPRQDNIDEDEEHQGKIYTFQSPPRKAPVRTVERSRQLDAKKLQMQLEKISLSSQGPDSSAVDMEMATSSREAELEADFLKGNISTEDEHFEEESDKKLITSKERYRSIIARTPSPRLTRSSVPDQMSPVPGQRPPHVSTEQSFKENENRNSTSAANQGPVPAKGSPTLRRSKLGGNRGGGDRSEKSQDVEGTPLQKSLPRSVSRCSVSTKKLKEIPKDDPRLSLSDEYDWRKYQSNNSSLASSMEANMLASLRRQQLEEMFEEDGEHNQATNSFDLHNYGDDDLSSSSSDDTTATFGTFKPPDLSRRLNRYQDEMHFPANGNPLLQSNPRDWGEPFSPPIVLPSEKMREEMDNTGMLLADQHSPNKDTSAGIPEFSRNKSTSSEEHGSRQTESTSDGHDEDELDLLYDPCLNCYFDPRSGKYYELK